MTIVSSSTPRVLEIGKQFTFEAAHTLHREIETDSSLRIHGHSYRVEVVLRGGVDPNSGMLMDLGLLQRKMNAVRDALDHRLLDEVPGLAPATMENIALFIWRHLAPGLPALAEVSVFRDTLGERCTCRGA
ncbi:6-carboxytetrahydropterin synthase [Granulibacter bethesdensis]|uniref:6-carboxy-5,6,7,8-tetrahydropterin synthase n=1 Tax=Granulibacter bethesdensis TaxID=364410 RepID=A0AAN0VH08_9PROT|nr:6-carboxytetrahydropterin synthase [Granulibacter bethesdensis]AHJ64208.1 Queuosine biosynthesis protein queD [Granulibacter bethesdensis]AHJ65204.1 Queuosine biosynthesis protein queD [Granulibacter bethesdensis CGDNIH4]APH60652.1 Queuosine biosynthesis protein queD [Granulibacter bethesdensis]